MPEEIAEILDVDARRRYFKNHARTQLIIEILRERYGEEIEKAKRRERRQAGRGVKR
jgi:hypothetical protein